MQTDPIADFATALRNALRAGLPEVVVPHSKLKAEIARVLQDEGYADGVETLSEKKSAHRRLRVRLKRGERGEYAMTGIERKSKPGGRWYVGSGDVPRVASGLGTPILSTSKGVMSGHQARKLKLGGEVLLFIK